MAEPLTCAGGGTTRPRRETLDRVLRARPTVTRRVVAVSINCTAPEHIEGAGCTGAVAASGKPAIAYPTAARAGTGTTRTLGGGGAGVDGAAAQRWVAAGAR